MDDTNPYSWTPSQPGAPTGPPRFLFVGLHLGIVTAVVMTFTFGLSSFDAPEFYDTPVGDLPFLAAVNRVASSYWFVPVFMLLIWDFLVLLLLRKIYDGPVRRRWFFVTTASIPLIVLLFWYALGSTVTMGL